MAAFRPQAGRSTAPPSPGSTTARRGAISAMAVNGEAVGRAGARGRAPPARGCVQVSTDYVFDGSGGGTPTPRTTPRAPLSAYGESKLAGRAAGARLRPRPGGAHELALRRRRAQLRRHHRSARSTAGTRRCGWSTTRWGAPPTRRFLARALLDLARAGRRPGVVHYRNREPVSWYAFAARHRALVAGSRRHGGGGRRSPRPSCRGRRRGRPTRCSTSSAARRCSGAAVETLGMGPGGVLVAAVGVA